MPKPPENRTALFQMRKAATTVPFVMLTVRLTRCALLVQFTPGLPRIDRRTQGSGVVDLAGWPQIDAKGGNPRLNPVGAAVLRKGLPSHKSKANRITVFNDVLLLRVP